MDNILEIMSQLTIYLDEELVSRVRQAADHDGISVSKWIARAIADRTMPHWPPEVLALAGNWSDEDIARPKHGRDARRERL